MQKLIARFAIVMFGVFGFAALASAQPWTVRDGESTIAVEATQQGVKFNGGFSSFKSQITFDPADLAASKAVVDIDINSWSSRSSDRDGQVGDADWFNVAAFPTARFETTEIRSTGESTYEADGTLSIKGITKPVLLSFTLTIDGEVATMSGEADLNRLDFNVGEGAWTRDSDVGHAVKVVVNLIADKG